MLRPRSGQSVLPPAAFPIRTVVSGILLSGAVLFPLRTAIAQTIPFIPLAAKSFVQADKGTDRLPAPEEHAFTTADGVVIKATYYAGVRGKETVPIILLHDADGSRQDYAPLAEYLQQQGHAIIAVDLRGFGESKKLNTPDGSEKSLEAQTMKVVHYQRMFAKDCDVEQVKGFLMQQNNDGKLNIEKLCVVGAGMSCIVAINWAVLDWSWPTLGDYKQGQDAKCLVLLSPLNAYKSIKIDQAMKTEFIKKRVETLIVVGEEDPKSLKDAQRIYDGMIKLREVPEDPQDQTLILQKLPVKLQGMQLLGQPELPVATMISQFIDVRVARNAEWVWKLRENPLE